MTYLEELEREMFFQIVVEQVEEIDVIVYFGGSLCRHTKNGGRSNWFVFDRKGGGKPTIIDWHTYIEPDDDKGKENPEHIGCPKGAGKWQVEGGTYLIVGADVTRDVLKNSRPEVWKIITTPKANVEEVCKIARQRLGLLVV